MASEYGMATHALSTSPKAKMVHKVLKEFHAKELHDGTYHIQKHHGHDEHGMPVKATEEASASDLDGVHDHLEEHLGGPPDESELHETAAHEAAEGE